MTLNTKAPSQKLVAPSAPTAQPGQGKHAPIPADRHSPLEAPGFTPGPEPPVLSSTNSSALDQAPVPETPAEAKSTRVDVVRDTSASHQHQHHTTPRDGPWSGLFKASARPPVARAQGGNRDVWGSARLLVLQQQQWETRVPPPSPLLLLRPARPQEQRERSRAECHAHLHTK